MCVYVYDLASTLRHLSVHMLMYLCTYSYLCMTTCAIMYTCLCLSHARPLDGLA